jgi:hypothetical protein
VGASPDYSDEFVRARERVGAAIELAQKGAMSREFDNIVRTVFEKYGVVGDAIILQDGFPSSSIGGARYE